MKKTILAGIVVLALGPVSAHAGFMLQPVSVTSSVPGFDGTEDPNELADQVGLSPGYVSGVTDFDAYIASAPTVDNCCNATRNWVSAIGITTGSLTFDLGGVFAIESLALWNRNLSDQGIQGFEIVVSLDAAFTSPISLGSFVATATVGPGNQVGAEVFGFAATDAAFVRIDVTSIYGTCCISASEVAFERTSSVPDVPEPTTLALLGLGLLGVGYGRRQTG